MSRKVWTPASVPDFAYTLFEHFDGCELVARPSGNQFVIGYGFLTMPNGQPVKADNTLTLAQAKVQLMDALQPIARRIVENVIWRLNEAQAVVLMYFGVHKPEDVFFDSVMVNKINSGDLQGGAMQFLGWPDVSGAVTVDSMRLGEFLRQIFVGTMQPDSRADAAMIAAMPEAYLKLGHDKAIEAAKADGWTAPTTPEPIADELEEKVS